MVVDPAADRLRTHVVGALERSEDPEVRYHLRQALQFLES
jgi:hypothetical protein